jgi:hypothetical protein
VDIIAVRDRVMRAISTGWDAVFIYPTFDHGDGSYGLGGNVAVDGLGSRGNSHLPFSPDQHIIDTLPQDPTNLANYSNLLQHEFGHHWLAIGQDIVPLCDGFHTHNILRLPLSSVRLTSPFRTPPA